MRKGKYGGEKKVLKQSRLDYLLLLVITCYCLLLLAITCYCLLLP